MLKYEFVEFRKRIIEATISENNSLFTILIQLSCYNVLQLS